MGRTIDLEIGEDRIHVCGYGFGKPSNMRRIYDDFALGQYFLEWCDEEGRSTPLKREDLKTEMDIIGDYLILDRSELEPLRKKLQHLNQNLDSEDDEYFSMTVEAILRAADKHPDINPFRFNGEF
jgi:hypothetical protein